MMLAHVLGVNRGALIAMRGNELSAEATARFVGLLNRRVAREPLAYILGHTEFYGRRFVVTKATLIPRVDTEVIVEEALRRVAGDQELGGGVSEIPDVVELGVGSGCILLSVIAERPSLRGFGVDRSVGALDVARRNAASICSRSSVELVESDWFSAFPSGWRGRLPLIVSNPPYIDGAERGELQPEVRDFEPEMALFTGDGGLGAPKLIIEQAIRWLRPGGWLLMEIGFGQSATLLGYGRRFPYSELHMVVDTAGVARVLCARAPT